MGRVTVPYPNGSGKPRGRRYALTEQKMQEIKEDFQRSVTDGSGSIDFQALNSATRDLGLEISEEEINQILAELNQDGTGGIEFDKFFNIITSKFVEMEAREELLMAFRIIDQDKNGKVSAADIQRIAKELGINFTEIEIQDMVDEADRDRDGEVSADEFMRMMRRTSFGY
ncbi:hypothetical protein ACJIZ3_006530 [Penstemon smallii]|uniref:EF-hand domain-containing protein n=1 Tax=Penstemon smallii TaxID=265156 RepID=A0ABD3S7Z0_9LAMI